MNDYYDDYEEDDYEFNDIDVEGDTDLVDMYESRFTEGDEDE